MNPEHNKQTTSENQLIKYIYITIKGCSLLFTG